ncbi:hypothetical protein [Actinoplanes sp. G11-F43]|uniref:hypothetical protein n=1 Tax=Actinoplanes sp. G11-F43 TaxID=3424130 RepID=UPI003D32B068
MTVYDIAARLPGIDVLRRRCQALALLDAIIDADYYTFGTWGDGEVAAMRDGSGEEFDIVFRSGGVFIRGVYHESPMLTHTEGRLWPNLLTGLPEQFRAEVDEPAFNRPGGGLDATFVLWRRTGDDRWHAGEGIDFSPADDDEVNPDGSWLLNVLLDDITEKYAECAEEVFEVTLPPAAIRHIVEHRPWDDAVVDMLNPKADHHRVRATATEIGYPPATRR